MQLYIVRTVYPRRQGAEAPLCTDYAAFDNAVDAEEWLAEELQEPLNRVVLKVIEVEFDQ